MDGYQAGKVGGKPGQTEIFVEILSRIEDQGRQTLELVRALVTILMPKEGSREGPSLEDLIAVLITQQRETIIIAKAIQEDLHRQGETLPLTVAEAVMEQARYPGTARK